MGRGVRNLRSQRIVSSGGVIFRTTNGEFEVALISRGKLWCLPKGLIEACETAEETALREIREETGLTGEILKKIGKIHYDFIKEKHFFKTVHFYLLKFIEGSIDDHDYEVDTVKWFPISDGLQILTYPNEKRILEKANKILSQEHLL
ncbi:NUDIX hydrolase [Candidatus Bathyarchaeota archaeon]|nr:MAG: NUDIX hydrolase [Candidatus Bathyarchaeota archaeon]